MRRLKIITIIIGLLLIISIAVTITRISVYSNIDAFIEDEWDQQIIKIDEMYDENTVVASDRGIMELNFLKLKYPFGEEAIFGNITEQITPISMGPDIEYKLHITYGDETYLVRMIKSKQEVYNSDNSGEISYYILKSFTINGEELNSAYISLEAEENPGNIFKFSVSDIQND